MKRIPDEIVNREERSSSRIDFEATKEEKSFKE